MSAHTQGSTEGGANVLVHTSAIDEDETEVCLDFLTETPPSETNVLVVSYTQTPDDYLQTWLDYTGERPANLGFIQVGGMTRSATTTQSATTQPNPHHAITTLSNPSDLTELGIQISEHLSAWAENSYQTVLWFDSLTALLQYTDGVQHAFQFLHTLVGRVQTAHARACYTIVPDAHDDQTVAILTSLFDTVHQSATHR